MKLELYNKVGEDIEVQQMNNESLISTFILFTGIYRKINTKLQWAKPDPIRFRGYIKGTTNPVLVNKDYKDFKDFEIAEFHDKEDPQFTRLAFVLGGM